MRDRGQHSFKAGTTSCIPLFDPTSSGEAHDGATECESCAETPRKIVDFGLACCFTRGEAMRQCAGTAIYVAPQAQGQRCMETLRQARWLCSLQCTRQVLECKYDHSIDLWSCGVPEQKTEYPFRLLTTRSRVPCSQRHGELAVCFATPRSFKRT